jgi:hypothetical protein
MLVGAIQENMAGCSLQPDRDRRRFSFIISTALKQIILLYSLLYVNVQALINQSLFFFPFLLAQRLNRQYDHGRATTASFTSPAIALG